MAGNENASISFDAKASGELDVTSEHPQLTVPSGATGKETYTWLNGNPLCYGYPAMCNQFASQQADPDKNISFDVSEFPFPKIDSKGKSTHISGSGPMKVSYPIMAWQPADATATASCIWDFQFGIPSAP
jgi:hypothetical protein